MKKTLYILQDGQLHRKDNSLYFESEKGRKFIPVEGTNDIFIFGNVRMSKRFLDFCTQKRIPVHYFDISGNYIGTYYPREFYNSGHIIIKQVEFYLNKEKRLVLAKTIANGYLEQCSKIIKYYINRLQDTNQEKLKETCYKLGRAKASLDKANIDEMMSIVENVEKAYYNSFNFIFNNPDFIDGGNKNCIENMRKKILIKMGESMGLAIVLSEIYKTHLDPRIGYFHNADIETFPLCLDILYIFKPIMIHRLIFTLVNKSMVSKNDFKRYKDSIVLTMEGKAKFITELDKRMRTTVKHRYIGRHVSYRRIIRLELYKIQKHIIEGKDYVPYQTLW